MKDICCGIYGKKIAKVCRLKCGEWWKKPERTTDHEEATGKLYYLRLQVEGTVFCNLQSGVRTHVVLVMGLYELLGNPTT